jgi:hypothetical protein
MWQIVSTLIFYVWLFGVLTLLWLIWRSSTQHIHHMEQLLVDLAMKSGEAAKMAADAAHKAVEKSNHGAS